MIKPHCFGIWWEAIPGPAGSSCRECVIKDECLNDFATITLPAAQKELGPLAVLASLSSKLEVDEMAILAAMDLNFKPKKPKQTPVKAEPEEPKNPKEPEKTGSKKAKKTKRKAKKKSWGKQTHKARWTKEREKHPSIGKLTPGTVIEVKYKGADHSATVKKGGYDYDDKTFPTLGALTTHIVGGGRSAVKFWKLEQAEK